MGTFGFGLTSKDISMNGNQLAFTIIQVILI